MSRCEVQGSRPGAQDPIYVSNSSRVKVSLAFTAVDDIQFPWLSDEPFPSCVASAELPHFRFWSDQKPCTPVIPQAREPFDRHVSLVRTDVGSRTDGPSRVLSDSRGMLANRDFHFHSERGFYFDVVFAAGVATTVVVVLVVVVGYVLPFNITIGRLGKLHRCV